MYMQIYTPTPTHMYVFMCIYLSTYLYVWAHAGCIKMADYQNTVPRHAESHDTDYKASQQLPG